MVSLSHETLGCDDRGISNETAYAPTLLAALSTSSRSASVKYTKIFLLKVWRDHRRDLGVVSFFMAAMVQRRNGEPSVAFGSPCGSRRMYRPQPSALHLTKKSDAQGFLASQAKNSTMRLDPKRVGRHVCKNVHTLQKLSILTAQNLGLKIFDDRQKWGWL